MSRIALIRDGVVVNVIEADLAFASSLHGYDAAVEAGAAGPGWAYADGLLMPPQTPEPVLSLEKLKQQLRERTTALRWERETGGITVGGVRVLTGIEDQNRIATALIGAPATVDFKADSGWVRLTLSELQTIAAAITAHVQRCFSAERAHHEAIDALETPEAALAYDALSNWP
ncbi:hypothetical protein ARC78_15650 [Stenotrophomonas pictorum JCM 9942]|uniref:DUF4376 domain-containing protein n=1 Tax=Stenotrophomonas pictorum JCM 9942 TaxID=1236960 RepID=A0A0R0AAL8_9GAMM|nr:DUF4376 domain-containing protein [Stenotrophomonas pictorum]KRG38468.1 hypothetical protein ARC78_15650 [Stenotrophomonas pictorum JCM 9942]